MVWDLPPVLGIGIPVAIISSIGYGGHLFIFHKYLSISQQIWFQSCLTLLWISYILAIFKDPGAPPKDFIPSSKQWKVWCKKCQAYKPERTHHCKTCRRCVKQMDHHCPWVNNCIGHENMPYFLRFLLLVDYTNCYAFVQLVKRILVFWEDRNLPIYLISKVELVAVIILTPLSFGVLITIGLMTVRWLYSIAFKGMTQIETWEYERIESQLDSPRFLEKIQQNYRLFNGKELLSISSWSAANRTLRNDDDNHDGYDSNYDSSPFDTDDIIFPYDIDPWTNLVNACGHPWTWFWPWGKSLGDGITFPKNEYFDGDENDLSSIPWPPDGNHQENTNDLQTNSETGSTRRRKIRTVDWHNNYGEKLSDFGVDSDA